MSLLRPRQSPPDSTWKAPVSRPPPPAPRHSARSADGTVLLWDVASRKPIGSPLLVERESFVAAAISRDGAHLYALPTGTDGIRLTLSPEAWKRHACTIAGRELSRREWEDALPSRPYRPVCGGSERAAHVAAELGPPTVLVNNAGFAHAADLADMTTEQWDADITVNLRGAFFAARAVCRHMIDAGWGRVINISSISALGDGAGFVSGQVIFVAGGPVD